MVLYSLKHCIQSPPQWHKLSSCWKNTPRHNEVLRLGNIARALFRRAPKDIPVNGYTIPEGWIILIAISALHLDNDQFNNALEFNPGRWKDIQTSVVAKSFMPFGVGIKQCAGVEYSRVVLATFLHVLITKYK
ncbi:hypothetical protein DCAR_0101051 [Daucus carota subsp. sativus]|uniref:Uncharacterized protein n=1 Tax=Daucus carota subsp. sativus TaxID=79200 RepID=A0A175YCD8_DAUCS|nr:hypothetical protein DCAR_0101051 [Daucus carota subsp. sativus]